MSILSNDSSYACLSFLVTTSLLFKICSFILCMHYRKFYSCFYHRKYIIHNIQEFANKKKVRQISFVPKDLFQGQHVLFQVDKMGSRKMHTTKLAHERAEVHTLTCTSHPHPHTRAQVSSCASFVYPDKIKNKLVKL